MKKLGKNKKKQWRHCYKGLDNSLNNLKIHNQILRDEFAVGLVKPIKQPIIKGDKDAAKLHSDIPTLPDGRVRFKRYESKNIKNPVTDLWSGGDQSSSSSLPRRSAKTLPALPLAGQSYNPSASDHYKMLFALGAQETSKRGRELKTDRYLGNFTGVSAAHNPVEDARNFVQLLAEGTAAGTSEQSEEVSSGTVAKKPKSVNKKRAKNTMAVDLNNIPKLLKEIKQENRKRALSNARLKERKLERKRLKGLNWDIPFQLPNELVPSLRKLTPEGNLMREVEQRRNTCPRSRRTLGLTKNTKTFDRRRTPV